jgi:sugar-specific transcriptional regulator TrmB
METTKEQLIKEVDILISKKKKLYSDIDIESPMSKEEKELNKQIANLFSQIQEIIMNKRNQKPKNHGQENMD